MDKETKSSVTEKNTWFRGLHMLLFAILYSIAELVVVFVALFHFVALLFTRKPMQNLLDFGDDLSIYIYQILQYVTFNSDEKPFPFGPWPGEGDRPDDRWDDELAVDEAEDVTVDEKPAQAVLEGEVQEVVDVEPVAEATVPEAPEADVVSDDVSPDEVPTAEDGNVIDFESGSDDNRHTG